MVKKWVAHLDHYGTEPAMADVKPGEKDGDWYVIEKDCTMVEGIHVFGKESEARAALDAAIAIRVRDAR